MPLLERGEDADDAEQAARDVDDGRACTQGSPGWAGHVGEAPIICATSSSAVRCSYGPERNPFSEQ